jgi:mono/diheme cytochrome c family protein
MISGRMLGALKIAAGTTVISAAALGLGACGSPAIKLAKSNPYYHGAQLFTEHCAGCHTLDVAGTEGSATRVRDRLRTNGPNFNVRKEQADQVLYAIRNGGFSGAIMPQNVVVGSDAQAVAGFLARYSGLKAKSPPGPGQTSTTSAGGGG